MSSNPPQYFPPRKLILTKENLEAFQQSETHQTIVSYITALNESVVGVKLTDDIPISPNVQSVLDLLDQVEEMAKGIPPVDNKASRFGNPAFRTFYDKILEVRFTLLCLLSSPPSHAAVQACTHTAQIYSRPPEAAVPEISVYFTESWGNRTRIDYGSGMELNFLCWITCLEKLGVFQKSDHSALVIKVFWRYVQVMRVLQSTYWLEPAGSHGVWGLDDYHFLPFLWGAAQLRVHPPEVNSRPDTTEEFSKHYMYLACIQFINSVKTASLRWHSPMLDDISAVKTWDKVNEGLLKMYLAEVLGKLPQQTGWGDCCGIPVPSAFAAAQAEASKKPGVRLAGPGIRPVPFD
ncbi:Phosphotyrosyl phosphatase activator [Epithele typhae]|uniref:Phosphotyrosyl phosphatase activator n=1 Tax=Epithele typhae TaxID=378194 RepID=UPI0020074762|nr:Phosphotyrosyl phosphatase activator [Epithele typhae]KAH9927906.1 Phosphotyrosyl phosphatase activator [Epithele typhae]